MWRAGRAIPPIAGIALVVFLSTLLLEPPGHSGLTGAILLTVFMLTLLAARMKWRHDWRLRNLAEFIRDDPAATCIVDAGGRVVATNSAAAGRFDGAAGASIEKLLAPLLDDAAAVCFRLRAKSRLTGFAEESVSGRAGVCGITVRRVAGRLFQWSIAEGPNHDPALGAPSLPMAVVDGGNRVIATNAALERELDGRPRMLGDIFAAEASGGAGRLRTRDGPRDVGLLRLPRPCGRQELYFVSPEDFGALPGAWGRLDQLSIAFVKLTPEGRVLAANGPACRLLQLDPDAAATGSVMFTDLVEGLGRSVADWIAATAAEQGVRRPEVVRATGAEREIYLQVTLGRITDGENRCIGAVLNDATELKTLEAQFVQSQKMQAIGQLAGGVAHDFNNLLTAISGHCDLLLLRHDPGDPDHGDLQQINQNANRAASLVGQLLAFSRKQNLRPECLDLRETLADLAHLLNRLVGERIDLVVSHDAELQPTRADRRQIEQVIMNLVVNARDAMIGQQGEIRITTSNHRLSSDLERERATVPAGEYVLIKVADTGSGIAPDKRQKIFEPFYTTKKAREGTGLGLSTVYGIVKQTGGFIFVDSEPGRGSEFTVYLPAAREAGAGQARARDAAPMLRPPRGDGVILLVEDEASVRAFAARALRMRGYTVLEAETAEMALEQLSDSELEVDLFVTDVILPGTYGPGWVTEALKSRPDVPVVFVSGYAEESFAKSQEEIPNSVFLPKPFSLAELTATVQEQLS